MLYFILKLIFKAALKVFYKRIEVQLAHPLPTKGPLLIVANHPNTFMDPIVIASLLQQEVYFIAKSTVFGSALRRWLLQKMNLIPVYRRQDGAFTPGANNDTFEKCYAFLNAEGTLLIFPEGTSFNERRLRPLKTGAARIALGAAARQNFSQNIYVLPVGLNYLEPTRFRSNVFVSIAAPILINQWAALYQQDAVKAIRLLTEQIRAALEDQIIHTPTQEDDELVRQIEVVYKSQLLPNLTKGDTGKEVEITRHMVASLEYFKIHHPEKVKNIKRALMEYLQQLKALRLNDTILHASGNNRRLGYWLLTSGLFLLLGLPGYVFGLVTNYLPYKLPAKVAQALTEEEEFIAPILLTVGIFTFPIFYALELYLVWVYTHSGLLTVFFLLSLPIVGFFALHYYKRVKSIQANLKLQGLFFKDQKLVNKLMQQREQIITELELARQEYLHEVK